MLNKEQQDPMGVDPSEIIAFLGKGTEFKGIITYSGTVRIDGQIEGEVITQGTLVIGESATIDAKISAGTVVCAGKLTGDIITTKKVHLLAPATMSGSVRSPVLIVEEGVRFNGHCDMGLDEPAGSEAPSNESADHTIHNRVASVG